MPVTDRSGDDANVSAFAEVLEVLEVTATVELARRRVPLAELLQLRVGDALAIGAALTAGVALFVDGTPFARGELVEIDGVLGVRVTSLGGQK